MKVSEAHPWLRYDSSILVLLIALSVAIISLDIFTLIGDRFAPAATGRVLCILKPAGVIGQYLYPRSWGDYADVECRAGAVEPAVSMVSLMIKTSLGFVGALIIYIPLLYLIATQNPNDLPDEYKNLRKKQAAIKEFKQMSPITAIFVGCAVIGWALKIPKAIPQFDTSLWGKFAEDILLVASVFGAFLSIYAVVVIAKLLRGYLIRDS